MTKRYYANNSPSTTLASGINNLVTSMQVASLSGFPASFPYTATIELGDPVNAEIVLVTAAVGTTLTITRGYDGTTAVAHAAGKSFDHTVGQIEYREAGDHVNATSGIHGLTGAPVGTTDVQTLNNKTLSSPTLNTPALSGGSHSGSISGAPNFTGAVILSGVPSIPNGAALAGTFTGNPAFSGEVAAHSLQVTGSYTNETAASAALGNHLGQIVWLTAPVNAFGVGLYVNNGSSWVALTNDAINPKVDNHQHGYLIQSTGNVSDIGGGSAVDVVTISPAIPIPSWAQDGTHNLWVEAYTNPTIITAAGVFQVRLSVGVGLPSEGGLAQTQVQGAASSAFNVVTAGTFPIGNGVTTIAPKIQAWSTGGTGAIRFNNSSVRTTVVWKWLVQ